MTVRSTLPLALLAFLLSTSLAPAQYWHCPFDGDAALVVEPRDAETGRLVSGLRVTVVLGDEEERISPSVPLPLYATCDSLVAANSFYARYPLPWFVPKDSYMRVVPSNIAAAGSYVEVEDVDGAAGGGVYPKVLRPITNADIIPICSAHWHRFDSTVYRPQDAGPIETPPVVVIELRRQPDADDANGIRSVAIESAKGILH